MEQVLVNNPSKIATKWALINAATFIVLTYTFEFINIDAKSGLNYITYVPFISFLFLTQKEFKGQLGGYISFGAAFSAGFRFAVFTGLVVAAFIYLYFAVLSPAVFEKTLEASQAITEEKGLSSSDIDKGMEMSKKWGPLMAAFGTALSYAIFGVIISLIGAAIFKKERSPYDTVDDAIDPTA